MESFEAFLDQEWESLTNMFSFDQDSDSLQFPSSDHTNAVLGNNYNNLFFPCDLPIENPIFYPASQESTTSSEFNGGFFQDSFEPMDFILHADQVRQLEAAENNGDSMQVKRKFVETTEIHAPEIKADKRKRNPQSKKSKKSDILNVQETACSSEEADSNELTNRKSKAGKSPATDPQSIYARKRRERINERLKILQTLVPNGTKVDISTMLEEAVDYVKFLQLQIKVLSSDDMWMYAPIAYNGMDMGLYKKILPNL